MAKCTHYTPLKLLVKRTDSSAELPEKGTPQSVGFDLHSAEKTIVNPGQQTLIETNIACQFPVGHYGRIAPRSGLAVKQGIFINAGVIDPDYRGTLKV